MNSGMPQDSRRACREAADAADSKAAPAFSDQVVKGRVERPRSDHNPESTES
jgi:hypothetical protein